VYVEKNLLDSNIFILCPSPRFNKWITLKIIY
jgi:hypothetical protein